MSKATGHCRLHKKCSGAFIQVHSERPDLELLSSHARVILLKSNFIDQPEGCTINHHVPDAIGKRPA